MTEKSDSKPVQENLPPQAQEQQEAPSRADVFGPPPEVQREIDKGVQVQTTKDLGFEIPIETIPIPSGGKVYPEGSSLHNVTMVDIKAMTAREEDILTSRALIRKGTVITELIRSCLINKSIDPTRMLAGDRNALMVAIRITGYGTDYDAEVECPSCGDRRKSSFNLGVLSLKSLDIDPVTPGRNEFQVVLPMTKAKVNFKFLTGEDEQEMSTIIDRKRKQGIQVDNLVTLKHQFSIVSVNGKGDRGTINNFIRNMPARDSLYLRGYIEKHEPGIDMTTWTDCDSCGEGSNIELPLGANFFWPDSD